MGLQMAWKPSASEWRRPPLGLKNLGNSCYLNSVLQCLTYTPPLAQFCLSSEHSSLCKRLLANKEKECPFCILERQIARSLKLDGHLDAPSKVQKCLNLFAENFRWGRQEDAHEFLRYVIDSCHNTCLKLLKHRSTPCNGSIFNGNGGTPNGPLQKEEASEANTIMNQIFGGSLLSQVKCLSCKGESNKTDEIMDISLDLFESNSLRDALSKFFRAEVLDGSNKYSCQRCKKLSVAKKQMFIVRAPNVLVIQLKRFEGVHGGKINRNIEFEELLELSNYVYTSSQESEPKYNLFGSIVHAGYSPESGHYYAYIKDAYGRWYCCNDAHVSLSSSQEVLSEKVYILFYLRCNQHQKSNKTGSSCNGVKPTVSSQNDTSTCENSAESTKSLAIKNNGLLSSTNNVLPVPKNGSLPTNPQFKPINSNSFETSRPISNGDEKLVVHANKRSNEAKRSPAVEKAMLQSRSCVEPKCTDNLSYSNVDSEGSTNLKKNGLHSLSNTNGRCRSPINSSHENNACNLRTGGKDPSFEHSSGIQCYLMSAKRKLHDDEQADDLVSSAKKCSILPSNDMNHSSEELNKFKEFPAPPTANNVLPVPKNGSLPTNPQFKPINSNSFETSRPISNGDEKLVVHANKRSNEAKRSPAVEKAMLQSRSCVEPKCTDNLSYSNVDSEGSTNLKKNGLHSLSNTNGRCRSPINSSHENNACNLRTGGKDPSFEHSSGIQCYLMSAKRKLHDDEQADDLVSSAKKCSILPSNDMNHSSEELNKFKEFLASEALSGLRSCDWFDKVHDFMRAGKRSRTQAAGPLNNAELKEELINGARENFISQIPVSLKGRLIELLKSFSQSHSLLDI